MAHLYRLLLEPRGNDDESRRREFMTNLLLGGLSILMLLQLASAIMRSDPMGFDQEEDSLLVNGVLLWLAIGLWWLSRRGYQQLAATSLLLMLAVEAIRVTLDWSFELPMAQLLCAVVIVVSGVLLHARTALCMTITTAALSLLISYGQIYHHLRPQTYWLQQKFQMTDAFAYVGLLCVISLVSWATNREMSHSLSRAHASEARLAKERDNLELAVTVRTRELQESQLLRNLELERFAEFGRLSASLLHEVANPLTAASLHLEQIQEEELAPVRHARASLQQLQRYIVAARKQLKHQGQAVVFSVADELESISLVMKPLANRYGISLTISPAPDYQLYGDPIKFNHIVANLITNAIDSYAEWDKAINKTITVSTRHTDEWLVICIEDHGRGIQPEALSLLFDAFYTTKAATDRGSGIGLSMVKRVVEEEFQGSIKVESKPQLGSSFELRLRMA